MCPDVATTSSDVWSRSGGGVVHTAATSVERGQQDRIGAQPAQRFRLECSEQLRRGGALCARRMHGESSNSLASTLISVARFGKQLVFIIVGFNLVMNLIWIWI